MKKILLFLSFLFFSISVWSATFQLVTNDNNLAIGDEIIIVNGSAGKALGTTQNSNNRNAVNVTISNNQITPGNTVQVLTLGKTNNHWTLYTGSGYLYAASSTKNYLRTQTTNNTNGEWIISISNNNATITAQGSNTNNILKYNSGSTIFSCYSSGQQVVQIYKKLVSYTITAVSNNNSYGAVSLSGTTITATPQSGYRISTSTPYTITSGTATVTNNGDGTFLVDPTSNCTVTINFEAIPTYTVHFKDSLNEHYFDSINALSVSLPTPAPTLICSSFGWEFAGWSESKTDFSDLKNGNYIPTQETTLYAVYRNGSDATSYTLDYSEETRLASSTSWGSYSTAYTYTANDGGVWIIKGYKNAGIQINKSKDASVKIPNCPENITSIEITGKQSAAVGLSASDYTGSGTITYIAYGTDATSQTLDLTGESVTGGYIVPKTGNFVITKIVVNYGEGAEYSLNPTCATVPVNTVTLPVDTITLNIGETYELTPTVLPSNATNKSVTWISTMPGIATVVDGVVTGVSEGTAAVIVATEDGSKSAACVVIVLGNPNINIVEWNPDWLKIDIENFTAATATLEDQNTQAEVKENIATKLFFSKYFEAAAKIKLWAIYNGTKDTIPLTNVKVLVSSNGNAWDESDAQKVTNLDTLGRIKKGYICPNEEIIVYNDGDKTGGSAVIDTAVMRCVNEKYNISEWYLIKNNTTAFSGDDGLMLLDGTDTLDIIGIMEPDYFTVGKDKHSIGTINNPHGDSYGWCCENGETVNGDSTALSTNRCLLIRKSTVHSGDTAVKYNRANFVTLCSEWVGEVVEKHEGDKPKDAEVTCGNFTYVGSYNYTDHYVGYDTIYEEKPIPGQEEDGFYKIVIPELDTLACTNLKITVKDASSNVLEEVVKIPIMIKTDATTTDATYFNKKNCDECDVVVLKNKILTVAGTTSANRDMKLYEGAELRVPTSTSYTLNSLALRRENDTVSSLYLNGGTLTVTNKVFFDLYITSDDWHYISLPGNFSLSNVKFINGKTPTHGKDYWARHYDGYLRSRNLTGGWQAVNVDSVFSAGQGFIFGLDDRHKKKEFRFEFNNSILTSEISNKTTPNLCAWGGGNPDLRPNHKGWNLIGNPFLGYYETDIAKAVRVGYLEKDMSTGSWNGQWVLSDTTVSKLRYAVIPSDAPEDRDAGGYKSVVLDDMKLLPFTCFFVQIGGIDENPKGIEFKASRKTNKIVARNYQEDEDDELFLRVKVDDWKTGCFISKNFSDKYEPGDDLESRYPIYQSIGGYNLLYSAINDSIIEHGVQVTAPQGTLYLDPKVDVDKFEYIYVNYNDDWFDLLHGETIDIETTTFILSAKRKVKENTTTDIDELKPTNGIYKFTDGNNVYINKNNEIYSVYGNKIK